MAYTVWDLDFYLTLFGEVLTATAQPRLPRIAKVNLSEGNVCWLDYVIY